MCPPSGGQQCWAEQIRKRYFEISPDVNIIEILCKTKKLTNIPDSRLFRKDKLAKFTKCRADAETGARDKVMQE